MSTFFNLFPYLPYPLIEIVIYVLAGLGITLMTYGIFLESERRQDAVLTIGALCLLTYATYIGNLIFSIAMIAVALASFVELMEIMLGRHIHSEELVEKYKHPER
ncbi:MAG: hypothetical protein WCT40_03735 [Candidatus Magasanikbacteria bacterium]|jgi:hypothetical protein